MSGKAACPHLSIIVPCLNEAGGIGEALAALRPWRSRGSEVIVVDGGSTDDTLRIAERNADIAITSDRGRAAQMNAGARLARGEVLLFLHADTIVPEGADRLIRDALTRTSRVWGRFDVAIRGEHPLLATVALAMNLRSRWTGIATGDQAIFVSREVFERIGGFPPIALMEDIALTRLLRQVTPPACIRERVSTSGRRWLKHGVFRTMVLMWQLRLAYALGADPNGLAARYAAHK